MPTRACRPHVEGTTALSIEDLRLRPDIERCPRVCQLIVRFPGVLFPCARFREVAVVVFYLCIRGAVAELAVDGWMACGCAGRLFFDDTFVFVTVLIFGHCPIGMMLACVLLYVRKSLLPVRGGFGSDTYAHAVQLAACLRRFGGLRITLDQRT